jgi:GAF domain-containing protein
MDDGADRPSKRATRPGGLAADAVRADVRTRRVNASDRVEVGHRLHRLAAQRVVEAGTMVGELRDRLDRQRLDAERRAAVLLTGGRRTGGGLAYFDADLHFVHDRAAMLTALVDAALSLAHADFGNVQLLDPEGGLRIVAQRGFGAPFLDHFAVVRDGRSVCGLAWVGGHTVTIADVAGSTILDSEATEVILGAGIRGVSSVPVRGPGGRPLGVLSVHYRQPHWPDRNEQRLLAMLAASAGRRLSDVRPEWTVPAAG